MPMMALALLEQGTCSNPCISKMRSVTEEVLFNFQLATHHISTAQNIKEL